MNTNAFPAFGPAKFLERNSWFNDMAELFLKD